LIEPGAPLILPVDDTLLHRLGRKVYATFWHHDATANSDRAAVAWGNNWVVVGVLVRLPFMGRAVCLPILFRLWQPRRKDIAKAKPDPQRPAKPELAREMVDLIAARFPDRTLHVVGDSAYGSGAWRGLAPGATLTVRPRKDAALYKLAPPRTGKRGRPAKKGARLPSLSQIALDPATTWQTISARGVMARQKKSRFVPCAACGPADWAMSPSKSCSSATPPSPPATSSRCSPPT